MQYEIKENLFINLKTIIMMKENNYVTELTKTEKEKSFGGVLQPRPGECSCTREPESIYDIFIKFPGGFPTHIH